MTVIEEETELLEMHSDIAKRARLPGPVNEGLLKSIFSVDAIGLGASQPTPITTKRICFESVDPSPLVFVFHYASQGEYTSSPGSFSMNTLFITDVLEAKEIIPTGASTPTTRSALAKAPCSSSLPPRASTKRTALLDETDEPDSTTSLAKERGSLAGRVQVS